MELNHLFIILIVSKLFHLNFLKFEIVFSGLGHWKAIILESCCSKNWVFLLMENCWSFKSVPTADSDS